MTSRRTTISFSEARTALGLTRWQMRLAVRLGLLSARPSGRLELASFEAAQANPTFHAHVAAEERMLASQVAKMLGMPVARLREAARAGLLQPVEYGSWRYGAVPLYRREDVQAAAPALLDWWQTHPRPPLTPVARALRQAAAARLTTARRQAISQLDSERAALIGAGPREEPLLAASLWLARLFDFQRAYHNSSKYANVRARAKWYEARSLAAEALRERSLEIIAASGHPLVSLTRWPDSPWFQHCAACKAAALPEVEQTIDDWDWVPTYEAQPGCLDCRVPRAALSVVIRLHLTSGIQEFLVPLTYSDEDKRSPEAAGRWTALGDTTLVRHPFREAQRSTRSSSPFLPGLGPRTLKALEPATRATLIAEYDAMVDALRAQGIAPSALVPAWFLTLPIDPGLQMAALGAPVRLMSYGPVDRREMPFETVVAELGQALANFPHAPLFAVALDELPGLDL